MSRVPSMKKNSARASTCTTEMSRKFVAAGHVASVADQACRRRVLAGLFDMAPAKAHMWAPAPVVIDISSDDESICESDAEEKAPSSSESGSDVD